MKNQVEKSSKNTSPTSRQESQSFATEVTQMQACEGCREFEDNRPMAAVQRKIQEIADAKSSGQLTSQRYSANNQQTTS